MGRPDPGSAVDLSGTDGFEAEVGRGPSPSRTEATPDHFLATLALLWRRHRPANLERVRTLEVAAVAVLEGRLEDELRTRAETEAHKLAGSLGTFGFEQGSRLALEIEALLQRDDPDGRQLSERVVELLTEVDRGGESDDHTDENAATEEMEDDPDLVRVLLAGHDTALADAFVTAAPTSRVHVELASDERVANRRLAASRYDAVIADLDMPDRWGWQILTRACGLDTPPLTFGVTAIDDFTTRLTAARIGIDTFVRRPSDPHEVLGQIALAAHRDDDADVAILAVDDDPAVIRDLKPMLSGSGRRLVAASNAENFWELLEEVTPALALVDLDMVAVDGFDLCRMIRADYRWCQLPVIASTARVDAETVRAAFMAGADDCVTKPFGARRLPALEARVDAHLERSRAQTSLNATDALTGVDNRRQSEEKLGNLIQLAVRQGQPLTFALIRIDDFMDVNSLGGHATGDSVLRTISELLLKSLRGEDVVGRWSGTEFAVGMYAMEAESAEGRLNELLDVVRSIPFASLDGDDFEVSFSAGIAEFPVDAVDLDGLYRAADRVLHRAAARRAWVQSTRSPERVDTGIAHVDVAVVDDDETLSDLLAHALQDRGHEVQLIADGLEAVELLEGGLLSARVVLLDVGLPGLDGFGVIRRLRAAGVLDSTSVIMLTARASSPETLNALELGAVDHVSKPFSLPVLMERIEKALAVST